jgi:serine/threonine-protein kinase RsbW
MKESISMLDERTVEVTLPNRIGYERMAMECSASFAKMIGFVSERVDDLRTAVSEACLNAIEHGNKGRPNARVVITINYNDANFMISVTDEGEGIKSPVANPDIQKKIEELEAPRGMGIFLIKQLADQFEFSKLKNSGHTLKMIFKLPNRRLPETHTAQLSES